MSDGVSVRPAPGVTDVTRLHRYGKNIATAPTATTTWRATRPSRVEPGARVRSASAIRHPPSLTDDLHDRDAEDDGEQQPRERRRLARGAIAEREVVDLEHD